MLDVVYIVLALVYESHWIQFGLLMGVLEGYAHYRLTYGYPEEA